MNTANSSAKKAQRAALKLEIARQMADRYNLTQEAALNAVQSSLIVQAPSTKVASQKKTTRPLTAEQRARKAAKKAAKNKNKKKPTARQKLAKLFGREHDSDSLKDLEYRRMTVQGGAPGLGKRS